MPFQCWASDNFCGWLLIWSDQIRKTPVFTVCLISDLIWWFQKKIDLSDRNLIKTPKTLFLCALHIRFYGYFRSTCSFVQQKTSHTPRRLIMLRFEENVRKHTIKIHFIRWLSDHGGGLQVEVFVFLLQNLDYYPKTSSF